MKIITREFTQRERALLLVLSVLLLVLVYYLLVEAPVTSGIAAAKIEEETLKQQVAIVNARLEDIGKMEQELEEAEAQGKLLSRMPSYSGEKKEVDFLHEILAGTLDYYIGFDNLTREGDQVRRNFSLQYKCSDYQAAEEVMRRLEQSRIRCLIGDVAITPAGDFSDIVHQGPVQVNCTATFYETMQGGTPDRKLPEDTANE